MYVDICLKCFSGISQKTTEQNKAMLRQSITTKVVQ